MRQPVQPQPRPVHRIRSLFAIAVTATLLTPSLTSARRHVCDSPIQHPVGVRVVALDPVRRGEVVRLRVETTSRDALSAAQVVVAKDGGAQVLGARRAALGAIGAGRMRQADFQMMVPTSGKQFLVQFRVTGEGIGGAVSRGAVYNLLPDGPQLPTRQVDGAGGERLAEFPATAVAR